ncbi:MAG: hypothetical protein ACM359_03750 [Bacillota bacterium]
MPPAQQPQRLYYRRADGTPTREPGNYRALLGPLRRLYGPTSAAEFGPLKLKAVRPAMIDQGWCRNYINQQVMDLLRWRQAGAVDLPSPQ